MSKQEEIDRLAADLSVVSLAEWIAIEHGETRLQAEKYKEEAQGLAELLYTMGFRLVDLKNQRIPAAQPGS